MIDIVCINPGMEERVERLLREAEKETLAHDRDTNGIAAASPTPMS